MSAKLVVHNLIRAYLFVFVNTRKQISVFNHVFNTRTVLSLKVQTINT